MYESKGTTILIIIGVVFVLLFSIASVSNISEETVIINRTELQQNIKYDGNGDMYSETVLMVYTDKGTYEVEQKGIFANPQYIGILKEGKRCIIKSVGFDCPILGMYKAIIDVK